MKRWNIKYLMIERLIELMEKDNFHYEAQEAVRMILEHQQKIDGKKGE